MVVYDIFYSTHYYFCKSCTLALKQHLKSVSTSKPPVICSHRQGEMDSTTPNTTDCLFEIQFLYSLRRWLRSPEHYCIHEISGVSWNSFGFFEAMLKNPAARMRILEQKCYSYRYHLPQNGFCATKGSIMITNQSLLKTHRQPSVLSWLYEAQGRVLYYLILYSRGYCFVNPEMALDIFTFAHMEVRSTALIMTKQGTCLGKKTLIKVWILQVVVFKLDKGKLNLYQKYYYIMLSGSSLYTYKKKARPRKVLLL